MSVPSLAVVAGPNGAGKTTLARLLFPEIPIVNPDSIAATLAPGRPEEAAVAAGRLALREIHERLNARESFGTETTLAGRWILRLMEDARRSGYHIEFVYVCVEGEWLASQRVWERKSAGGHFVPEADVWRRYHASLGHLRTALLSADHAVLYDNSSPAGPRVFGEVSQGVVVALEPDVPRWLERALGPDVRPGDDLRLRPGP